MYVTPVTLTFWCKRYTCVRGRRKGRRRAYQDPDHGSSNKKTLNFNFELKALCNEQINFKGKRLSQNIKKSVIIFIDSSVVKNTSIEHKRIHWELTGKRTKGRTVISFILKFPFRLVIFLSK